MQAMLETSERRRTECKKMVQIIPAKNLKPYRKSLENMPSRATEAKRKFYKQHSRFNWKKGNLKPYLGYSWPPDGNQEEIEEWRSIYNLTLNFENM